MEREKPGHASRPVDRLNPIGEGCAAGDLRQRSCVMSLAAVLLMVQLPGAGSEAIVVQAAPAASATLTVEMQTIRSSIPNDVSVTDASGQLLAGGSLADGETLALPDLVAGTYTISQADPTSSSSRVRGIECSNGQHSASNTIEVDLDAGADVTCTITNDPQTSTDLEVAVLVDWNDAPQVLDQTFEVCVQGPSYPEGTEAGACQIAFAQEPAFPDQDVVAWQSLENGDYDVTQIDPGADWQVTLQHQNPISVPGPAEIPGEPARAGFINSYSPLPVSSTTVEPAPPNTTLPSTGSSGTLGMTMIALLLVAIGLALTAPRRKI